MEPPVPMKKVRFFLMKLSATDEYYALDLGMTTFFPGQKMEELIDELSDERKMKLVKMHVKQHSNSDGYHPCSTDTACYWCSMHRCPHHDYRHDEWFKTCPSCGELPDLY
jgi:hypothetical protein